MAFFEPQIRVPQGRKRGSITWARERASGGPGHWALDWGLVSAVWPPSGLEAGLAALAGTLTTVSPAAAATAKAAILGEEGPAFDHPAAASRLRASADAETGLQAFLQKQPPRF